MQHQKDLRVRDHRDHRRRDHQDAELVLLQRRRRLRRQLLGKDQLHLGPEEEVDRKEGPVRRPRERWIGGCKFWRERRGCLIQRW